MPFDFALLIAFIAFFSAVAEASFSLVLTEASTAFITLFIFVRSVLLRSFLFSACLTLLSAERFFLGAAFAAKL
jgi:hypothetical protein